MKKMNLPISVEDVKREVEILRTLSGHENVLQIYAAFEDDDQVCIVMELVFVAADSATYCSLYGLCFDEYLLLGFWQRVILGLTLSSSIF
ncbi:hypothetical protein KC19_7G148400 [Ceratodon purpureus]|uniref:Protein kinase domain-containing protein n=1 Tax=Ceratodon purpureus TaxID=3225 RepID=A0A8T0H9V0_CERPU|nr:hypothetical protein KC19_7G148400 [Ceratodon purpureus]